MWNITKNYKLSFLIIFFGCCYSNFAYCFDDGDTHPRLTEKAVTRNVFIEYLQNQLGFSEGLEKKFPENSASSKKIIEWLQKGSSDEDRPPCRASNHFHNPRLSWDQSYNTDAPEYISFWCHDVLPTWPLFSNITWATGFTQISQLIPDTRDRQDMGWDNARTYFYQALTSDNKTAREDNFIKTFLAVGQTLHLLQDMAVPAHVRNDFQSHLIFQGIKLNTSFTTWWANPFEYYVKQNNALVSSTSPEVPIFTNPRVTDFWDTTDTAGDSPGLGLAEVVSRGYFSNQTIPGNNTDLSDPYYNVHMFPLPQLISGTYDCIDYLPNAKKPTRYVSRSLCPPTGGKVDHFVAYSFLNSEDEIKAGTGNQKKYVLDKNVHNTYAGELLPRAVGYSSALLDYFFRGKIDISVPANGLYSMIPGTATGFSSIKLRAKNSSATGEEMTDGSIELVVKYKVAQEDPFKSGPVPTTPDFSYIVVPEKTNRRTIQTSPVELNFDLSLPPYATDIYLHVVYKGKLGNEDGAVAVGFKDISEPTPIDMFNNMDKICINGSWYEAGSQLAIEQVDANDDDIAGLDEADVYAHSLANIYFRFSPYSQSPPYYYASPTLHDFTVPSINPGNHVRAVYILGDYMFNKSQYWSMVKVNDPDPYAHLNYYSLWWHGAVKRQRDYSEDSAKCGGNPPCYIEVYPEHRDSYSPEFYSGFYNFRGATMWWGSVKIMVNKSYPENSQCSYDLL